MRVGLLTMEALGATQSRRVCKEWYAYSQKQMVNPYTYTQFIVTEEPFEDADPNARLPQLEHSFRHLSDVNSIFLLSNIL